MTSSVSHDWHAEAQCSLLQEISFKISRLKGQTALCLSTGPDSLVVRACASGTEGRGFASRPRHTKGDKNGTGSSLANARNKMVVPGRYKKAGGYSLLVMSQ